MLSALRALGKKTPDLRGAIKLQFSGKSAAVNTTSGGKNFIHTFAQIRERYEICSEVKSSVSVITICDINVVDFSYIDSQIEIVFFGLI